MKTATNLVDFSGRLGEGQEQEVERITLTVHIVLEKDYEDIHITDDHCHSCNYGDSNYDNGATSQSIGECVRDFLRIYHKMK